MDSIAHYRLGEKLGQGAMGEVYRATDTKLGRDVAVKMIAPALAQDPVRLASFAREAQVLASLNHPNIATIYGVEDQALIMELVEGPTLAERITQGPIPLDEALPIARQIADALAAAHERGIVHRDLKPANIKLAPNGVVKLLDFGLARAAAAAATSAEDAATIAVSMTEGEVIAGTPAYMAPEQARGLAIDKRADIWAFGAVLYEMVTGSPLFTGATITDVLAAVVREQPDLSRAPASIRPALRRCLEKDPKRRLRDITDAMLLLEAGAEAPAAGDPAPPRRRAWLPWAAAAAALLAFLAVTAIHLRETAAVENTVRFKVIVPPDITFTQTTPFAISPDGRVLAFPALSPTGENRIWLQEFDKAEPRPLAATIPVIPDVLTWYDSQSILYSHDRKLKRIDINGGPPTTLVDYQPPLLGVAVRSDGTILYGSLGGIMKVGPSGGPPKQVTRVDASTKKLHAVADMLPDGEHFLYTVAGEPGTRGLYVGRVDASADEQASGQPILMTDFGAVFVPDGPSSARGHLLIVRESTIMAQRFDADSLRVDGEPTPVAENVFIANSREFGIAFYSASQEGTLVYRTGTLAERLSRQLAWWSRDGKQLGTLDELGRFNQVKLAPDATRVVTSRTELATANNADLWITDLGTETSTKFTFGGGVNAQPIWSPDGRQIAWARVREKDMVLLRKPADGSGAEEVLHTFSDRRNINVSDWTSDGAYIIYSHGGDVFALPLTGTEAARTPIAIAETMASEFGASVSPNRRWIAYVSNESSRQEVYVQPFAPSTTGGGASSGKWTVSRGTLGLIRWRNDSRELVFLGPDGQLMSVEVETSPVFKPSAPQALFQLPRAFLVQAGNPGALADTARDLQRLLLAMPSESSRRQELSVVLNWPHAVTSSSAR